MVLLSKCKLIIETQKESREGKRREDIKEEAVKGTHSKGGLNTRVYLEPIEKRFDWLSAPANIGVETITRFQNIIRPLLSGGNNNPG